MSALDLQRILIKELTGLFSGQLFQKPRESEDDEISYVPLNFFSQSLPFSEGEDGITYAPFIAVQIQGGKQDDETEPEDATVIFDIGIYDDGKENQGHVTVCNIIETIRQYLFKNRIHGGKYYIKLPFTWQINTEDYYSRFAGSIETHWNLPLTIMEDPYL